MKLAILLVILLMVIGGCKVAQEVPLEPTVTTTSPVSGNQYLVLTEEDLEQLGIANNGIDCTTEEYETSEFSPLAQYSFCIFNITSQNDTEVVLEIKKFTNLNDLNGSYQYESSHLLGSKGILSQNDYGDQSKFHVNNEDDYGAEFNTPGIYYYNLWFTKNEYLIHITSKGTKEGVKEDIATIGRRILSTFG